MPLSDATLMFVDARELMDKALASQKGIRIKCASHGEAIRLAHRLNKARVVDRRNNAKIYEPDQPMHNQSEFDRLMVTVPKFYGPDGVTEDKSQAIWVEIRQRSAESYNIEDIE